MMVAARKPAWEPKDPVFLCARAALLRAVGLVQDGVVRPRALAEGAFDRIIDSLTTFPGEGEGQVDLHYAALARSAFEHH